jgi:type I restriction enzyme S subunit
MIADLKPYPKMKDSGVPWLGEVPAHWHVSRLRNTAEMRVSNVDKHTKVGELPLRLCNYVDVYKNDRIRAQAKFMHATATADEIERFRLQAGDVLITKDSEAWNDIGVPALVEDAADDLVCGYHLALLRPHKDRLLGGYLFRAMQSTGLAYQFHVEANGVTRYGLSHAAIKSVWLPVPPLPEQSAIVRFLDHADRRIRRYIRARQKLIKLLEEQKQAIIHRAVTRGLDPNVRLKPSGVEWLGDVPEHWEVMPLRRASTARCDGPFGSGLKSGHYTDHGIRVVRLQNIGHAEFRNSSSTYIGADHYSTLGDHDVEDGDLLIAGLGDERHPAGRACVAPVSILPAMVKADCFRFRLQRDRLEPDFGALQLTATAVDASSLLSTGATRQRTNLQSTAARVIAVPPIHEQQAIVSHIENATAICKRGLRIAENEIDLLREYRTRLIADVVTGKLDVREAASLLSELPAEASVQAGEADEPEPLDEIEADGDISETGADDNDVILEEAEA